MDILHVHFEVVIPCKLLVAELALCHGAVGVVSQLVSDQHLLQAEGQVTNLRQWRQNKHKVLQFQACITLLRLHYWGHSHTYLQYLINELVFGRKTPSESTWKIFTLPGIFLCCILGVVAQAQGCCLSKKDSIFKLPTPWGVLVTLWCFVQIILKLLFYLGCSKNYDKTSWASISSNEVFPSWPPERHLQLPTESVPIAQLQGRRSENEEVLKTARKVN